MSEYLSFKQSRPLRHGLALFVFRAIWWPFLAACLPFALIGVLADWLSWTAFPAVARFYRPVGRAVHGAALSVGNSILGYRPESGS